jgi:hypothetical protein
MRKNLPEIKLHFNNGFEIISKILPDVEDTEYIKAPYDIATYHVGT